MSLWKRSDAGEAAIALLSPTSMLEESSMRYTTSLATAALAWGPMKRRIGRCAPSTAILLAALAPRPATAQQEIPPPSGRGRVVPIVSGYIGRDPYTPIASRIAALGYTWSCTTPSPSRNAGRALSAAIEQAPKSPRAAV